MHPYTAWDPVLAPGKAEKEIGIIPKIAGEGFIYEEIKKQRRTLCTTNYSPMT